MAETKWDIKIGASVYHQVSDARIKLWIKTGKLKAGEVVVWHTDFSGWRKPEELEELRAFFQIYELTSLGKMERPVFTGKRDPEQKQIRRILLIDDERDLCALLGDSLSSLGFQMEFAHTYKEALKRLSDRPPDLVLLDLSLPDGDGLALLSHIRNTTPALAVIITTAFGSQDVRRKAEKMGALGFLDKPYHEGDVIRRIRKISASAGEPG